MTSIPSCGVCSMDSAGNHAWNCPLHPNRAAVQIQPKSIDPFSTTIPSTFTTISEPSFDEKLDHAIKQLRELLDSEKSRYIDMDKVYEEIRERFPEVF